MIRSVVWLGDSKRRLREFPRDVQQTIGGALMTAQFGGMADNAKFFRHVGSGIFEIAERYDKNAYRLVYAVQIGRAIYVLHAFQKKSKTGIATPKQDVDLIKRRYREAQELAKDE